MKDPFFQEFLSYVNVTIRRRYNIEFEYLSGRCQKNFSLLRPEFTKTIDGSNRNLKNEFFFFFLEMVKIKLLIKIQK